MGVERLGTEILALLLEELVEVGQDGGVEADAIRYQQDELYAHRVDVVLQVHLILNQLDDGDQQVVIAQPAEDLLEGGEVFVGDALRDAVAEGSEDDHRDVGIVGLDVARHVEALVVARTRHADNQVEAHGLQLGVRLVAGSSLGEAWRVAQRERSVFIKNLLVDTSVILQHKGIVRIGYEQDIKDTPRHQVGKLRILKVELVEFIFAKHGFSTISACEGTQYL